MPGFNIGGGSHRGQPSNTLDGIDAHRAHRWKITQLLGIDLNDMPMYPMEVTLPSITMEEETVSGANIDYKIPKKIKYGDFVIKYYDMLGSQNRLKSEMERVGIITAQESKSSGLRRADNYMSTVKVVLLDGEGRTIRTYTGVNCFLKEISHSELTYTNSDIKLITITIGCSFFTAEEKTRVVGIRL